MFARFAQSLNDGLVRHTVFDHAVDLFANVKREASDFAVAAGVCWVGVGDVGGEWRGRRIVDWWSGGVGGWSVKERGVVLFFRNWPSFFGSNYFFRGRVG